MNEVKSIAVFCGSNSGTLPCYKEAAAQLAETLCREKISLVFGGAKVGLMGVLANSMIEHKGHSIGVIPQSLIDVEIAHQGLSELKVVESMNERKLQMTEISDGYLMLPGGPGSLDEFFEVLAVAQLGYHAKPCGILNTNHYYDDLLKFLDRAAEHGFMQQVHRNMIIIDDNPESLIKQFQDYQAPEVKKWVNDGVKI